MARVFEWLKRGVLGKRKSPARRDRQRRHRDSYQGALLGKEIEQAAPDRAGEVAGHPPERVDT